MKKYFVIPMLLVCLLLIFLLAGCKSKSGSYPSALAWDNLSYAMSISEISKDELGKQLGEINRRRNQCQ